MKRIPVFMVSGVLGLGTLALAQGGMDHSSMGGTSKGASPSGPGMAVGQMDMSGLKKLSGKAFERLPEHDGAAPLGRPRDGPRRVAAEQRRHR
ncbi:hypothetical protein ACFFLM_05775 [Deinococcus oregonensis]|uniref:Uncharacterized protein n=1 Tax=Deinococcus oregonensis TaxID=1805970 RepID=A0ABV6AWW0_9DEIO